MHPLDRLTYPEIGATAGELPEGYYHLHVTREIGHGVEVFEGAVERMLTWQMHAGAGVKRVGGAPSVAAGADVAMRWMGLRFSCRVVEVIEGSGRGGFAYGTLPGHPEIGEERFEARLDPTTGVVTGSVTAFSRPSGRLLRLAGSVGRATQHVMAKRYLAALT